MSLFSWANKQLESLADKLAPVPNDPGNRFSQALRMNDTRLALALLSQTPPPLPDGTYSSPLDPYSTVINRQKGSLAIHCAAEHAQSDVVFALIAQYGVPAEQFDSQGNTPLHYAVSSRSPAALNLVKALVTQYNVSVTVKNALGQTPYDTAVQDSVRQYLLPIQLQRETQECIDNGGHGLPQGIDMGGITIKRDIPPPPIGGFGSPPPMNGPPPMGGGGMNNYSAAGRAGGANYFVPSYGAGGAGEQQVPPSPSLSYPTNNTPAPTYPTQPPMGAAQPVPSPMPAAIPSAGVGAGASYPGNPSNNPTISFPSQPPTSAATPVPATFAPTQEPAPSQTPFSTVPIPTPAAGAIPQEPEPAASGTTEKTQEISTNEATSSSTTVAEPKSDNDEGKPEAVEDKSPDPIPSNTSPVIEATAAQPQPQPMPAPTMTAPINAVPTTTTPPFTSTYPTAASSVTTNVNANSNTFNTNTNVGSAPTSSGSGYARRGHSSAAVLPTGAKYKPDGFHSSSSDVSLQQKYGHDARITGPPSGTYARQVAPPPSGGSTGAPSSGQNPFAGGTSVTNAYSAYGGVGAIGRSRYPTYDAVSDTVGAAPGYNAHAYGYNNTASPAPVAQYNVYSPNPNQYQATNTQGQGNQQQGYDYNQQQHGYNYGQQQGYQQQEQQQQQHQYQQTYDYNQQQPNYNSNQQQPTNYAYQQQQQQQQQAQPAYDYSQQQAQPQQQAQFQHHTAPNQTQAVQNTEVQVPSYQQTEHMSPVAAPVAVSPTEPPNAKEETTPLQQSAHELFHQSATDAAQPQQPSGSNNTNTENVAQKMQNLDIAKTDASPAAVTVDQPDVNSANELFGAAATASPSAGVTDQVKTFSASSTATTSAADLFGSSTAMAQTAPSCTTEVDDSLPPPPIASDTIPSGPEGDDLLPPPPIGGMESPSDTDLDDDDALPPPPMMDVAL